MSQAIVKSPQRSKLMRVGGNDKLYYCINGLILFLLGLIVVYPLYFIIIASISDPDAIFNGQVFLYPVGVTLSGFKHLLNETLIWRGYLNTILYTLFGTLFNLILTVPCGYALSRPNMPFKRFVMWVFIVTMFFGGGLIPFYLLVTSLGFNGSPLALIIPGGVSVWNVFMVKAFFESNIAKEIIEACEVDGAGHAKIFVSIILPLSKPIIAVMALYYGVGHWNSYFSAMIFISKESLYPLQLVLRDILIVAEESSNSAGSAGTMLEQAKIANQIKYSSIIISSLPIILLYPIVQRFFEQGIMVGSLKS